MAFLRDPYKLYPHDRFLAATLVPFIPRFVTPNSVTVFRFLTTPLVLFLLATGSYRLGVPAFIFVALTDVLDGTLARLRRQVTPWGTFYDPVADKLLIGFVLLLILTQYVHPLLTGAVIGIEIAIAIIGFARRKRGRVVSANMFGKIKMILQVIALSLMLLGLWFHGAPLLLFLGSLVLVGALAFAVMSLLTYGL